MGGAQLGTETTLALPPGAYFWVVQALDSAWAGGPFARGASFVVGDTAVVITAYERRGASQFWIRFRGVAGTDYRVGWTGDFEAWHDLGQASETAPGQFEYLDTTATNGRRFYGVFNP